jgi:hypothetical protein
VLQFRKGYTTFVSKDVAQVKVFQNYVKVQNKGYQVKSFGTELKVSSCSIDIAQGKLFQNYAKVQDQGHKVKVFVPKERSLHHASKALTHLVQKIKPRLKFFKIMSSGAAEFVFR